MAETVKEAKDLIHPRTRTHNPHGAGEAVGQGGHLHSGSINRINKGTGKSVTNSYEGPSGPAQGSEGRASEEGEEVTGVSPRLLSQLSELSEKRRGLLQNLNDTRGSVADLAQPCRNRLKEATDLLGQVHSRSQRSGEELLEGLSLTSHIDEAAVRAGRQIVNLREEIEVGVVNLPKAEIQLSVHVLEHSRKEIHRVNWGPIEIDSPSNSHDLLPAFPRPASEKGAGAVLPACRGVKVKGDLLQDSLVGLLLAEVVHLLVGMEAINLNEGLDAFVSLVISELIGNPLSLGGIDSHSFVDGLRFSVPHEVIDGASGLIVVDAHVQVDNPTVHAVNSVLCLIKFHMELGEIRVNSDRVIGLLLLDLLLQFFVKSSRVRQDSKVDNTSDSSH